MNFKRFSTSDNQWHDTPHYIHNTSADTITTLPAVLYPNAVTATVGLKGNMEQTSQPSPTTPIQPSECGDLETSGTKAGQYKIPISSANTTTPVYLGEVETTRKIKKLVLTGDEAWTLQSINSYGIANLWTKLSVNYSNQQLGLSSHLSVQTSIIANTQTEGFYLTSSNIIYIRISVTRASTVADFQSYLAAQYAAGTPVTVWYVLANPTTGIVNEPLRKIGDYADEVSGITIPTIAGTNTLSIGTALQPSEVTVNYKGWHPVQSVHEYEDGNDNYIPDLNTLTTTVSNCVIESVSNNTLVLSGNGYIGSSFSQIISNNVMIPSNLIGKTVTLSGSIIWSSEGNIAPRVTIMMHRSGGTDYNVSIYQGAFTQTFEVPSDATSYALLFRIDQNRSEYVGTARVTYTNIELKEQPHWN